MGSMRAEKNPTNSDTEVENPYHINSSGIPQKEPLKIHSSDQDHVIMTCSGSLIAASQSWHCKTL